MGIRNYIKDRIIGIIMWAKSDGDRPTRLVNGSNGKYGKMGDFDAMTDSSNDHIENDNSGLVFTVFNAMGGKVIQIRSYDRKIDRSNTAIYIVTDQDNLGEELGHIITREMLTR